MVTILNLENGVTLNHSLVLIEGETDKIWTCMKVNVIACQQSGSSEPNQLISCWPIVNGRFKVLVDLNLGKNEVHFTVDLKTTATYHLTYVPTNNEHFIRLLYLVCKDDVYTGLFQGPVGQLCTETQAFRKIILAAKLIQAFISECLHRQGLERRTFRLELDPNNGQPICHRFVLKRITTEQAHQMIQNQLWDLVKQELASDEEMSKSADLCKFLAFISFTRYCNKKGAWPTTHQDIISLTKSYCALGGGGLALMGTGCLYTWPSSIEEVLPCFTDNRTVDRIKLLDESAYRGTYWACYSTTFGATCHELGHTFGLCHTTDGIMARGFDNMQKVFTVEPKQWISEAKSSANAFVNRIRLHKLMEKEWSGAFWTRETALWLYYHKWFNCSNKTMSEAPTFNGNDIRARHGIRVVILTATENGKDDEIIKNFWDFANGKGPLVFRLPNISEITSLQNKRLMVVDSFGNTLKVNI